MECKNCGHKIVKRITERNGEVIEEYKHKEGGIFCSRCSCENAEPKEDLGKEKDKKAKETIKRLRKENKAIREERNDLLAPIADLRETIERPTTKSKPRNSETK